jgi:hypothetical protein
MRSASAPAPAHQNRFFAALTAMPPAPLRESPGEEVLLRYVREGQIMIRGPYTQRIYVFDSPEGTAVDSRDVETLVATLLFKRTA